MRQRWWLFLLGWVLVLVSGCGGSGAPQAAGVTVTDAQGRAVTLSALPRRIAVAGRANFMLADALYLFPEARGRVYALTEAGQRTTFIALVEPRYQEKLRLASTAGAEEIAATKPDVVLLKSFMAKTTGEPLERLGIPVVYLDLESPEAYDRDLAVLGALLGDAARADEVRAYYREVQERVAAGVAEVPEAGRPRVLLVRYSDKGGEVAFTVPPAAWIQTWMVEAAGGVPVWKEAAQGNWTVVNVEQIAAWDPDVVFVVSYFADVGEVVAGLRADARWQSLRAVASGRLYAFAGDFYSWDQPDARWALGLLWVAKRLHPDRFADLDVQAEWYAFYEKLYGLDAATVDAEIRPRLRGDVW